MSNFSDPTVYPCGRGNLPGTQGQGSGGNQKPTHVVFVPKPRDPVPPFIPITPPEDPKWKCVEMSDGPPNIPKPGFRLVNPPYRECRPCNGAASGKPYGPATNPAPGDVGCVHPDKATCDVVCPNPEEPKTPKQPTTGGPTGPSAPSPAGPAGPAGPAPGSQGPITGGTQYYKCEPKDATVCPGDENLPLGQARIISFTFECKPCSRNIVLPNNQVVPDPACIYSSIADCQANCVSPVIVNNASLICTPTGPITGPRGPTRFGTIPVPPVSPDPNEPNQVNRLFPQVPNQQVNEPTSPSLSVNLTNQATQITNNQQSVNATIITANEIIQEEDFRNIQAGVAEPTLFEPELNFFKTESNDLFNLVPNRSPLKALNNEVTSEVAELLQIRESNSSWDEVTLQNLSDDQILRSLSPQLVNTFQYLRYPGGEPIGVATLVNVVRKHILEGTLDEFDPNYYLNAAEAQRDEKFEVLERPEQQEHADRLAINYLINNLYTFESDKSSSWRNFQINRMRPLNEDVKLDVNVTTLDGTVKDLSIPNEGFQVDTLSAVDQVTVPSVGSPNKLNIGNGGGYYVDSTTLDSEGVAVPTDNIIPVSYYAPTPVRMRVLNMLGVDPSITLTASSISQQHEFTADDAGASAIKPLFFAINLSSVEGDYFSDSLVENYSATYSLLTASSDIQVHMNNNALNVPMLSIDYRDPLYRYILDTSSFEISMNDFNLNGFKDKGFSSIGSRFVKNIPFGFVITPVAGGKFNPFNGNSTLVKHGDVHVRSMSVLPAPDSSIDGSPAPLFRAYNLNLDDGVDRVGIAEREDPQNIGYRYVEEDFTQTFYSASAGSYGTSSVPPSAQGTAYMLREVVDYLSATYNTTTLTWYDIFSRMPVTRVGEMFYDSTQELILEIANGLRGGITIENIEAGVNTTSRIIPEDSKTIVTTADRRNVTKIKI
jgi:hypothetical protein